MQLGSLDWGHQGLQVATALACGALIGVERGWKLKAQKEGARVAGVRTFSMLGLASGIAGLVGALGHPLVAAGIVIGVVAIMVIAYSRELKDHHDSTSAVAAIATIAIGFLAGSGTPWLAIASASIAVALLALRTELHGFIDRLDEDDLKALARYLIIAGAILPFLPNGHYGPLGAWNPQRLWLQDVGGSDNRRAAAMAKLHATESGSQVIDAAVQMHGGAGVTRGSKVEELYRDIRALRIYEGASEMQRQIIARDLLKGAQT